MSERMTIDIYFDFICPWCLIGKRQLEQALASFAQQAPAVAIELRWHGVQLLPDVPPQGWPFADFYERRLGSRAAVLQRRRQVEEAAAKAGFALDLGRIERFPNTARAHVLFDGVRDRISAAQRDALIERLFAAYFETGDDLGDVATLLVLVLARQCGIDADHLADALLQIDGRFTPRSNNVVGAVPRFLFNQCIALEGAQPPEILLQALHVAQPEPITQE